MCMSFVCRLCNCFCTELEFFMCNYFYTDISFVINEITIIVGIDACLALGVNETIIIIM